MRRCLLPSAFCILFLLTGCFQREIRIEVQADGSGTLEIRNTVSQAFLNYAEAHSGLPPDRIWFHEQALRHAASQYGEQVHYLEHETRKTGDARLFRVRYGFERIEALTMDIHLEAPFLLRPPTSAAARPPRFQFEQEPGLIRVLPPDLSRPASAAAHVRIESARARRQRKEQFERERKNLIARGNPFQIPERADPGEVLERLARDMEIRLRMVFATELKSSNARFIEQHPEGHATGILLFSFSGNEFIQSHEHLKQLAEGGSAVFSWHDLPDLPGVKIDTGEIIQIRF